MTNETHITEGDAVPTPPFGDNTPPVETAHSIPSETPAEALDRMRAALDDVQRERDEALAEVKVLRNAIEETREQLFICLPEDEHDEWTRFFEPHELAGMAVATLDHIAESNAEVIEQAQVDADKARKYIEAREKAWTAFTQRLNVILDMINLEVEGGMTHAQRNGANMLWRGLLDMALRQWKVRQRDVDEIPF